jgi:hypothetical protein
MLIVCLIKKYVFTITSLCRPILEDALFVYTVFGAEPLPKDGAHYNALTEQVSIVKLSCYYAYFGCHIGRFVRLQFREACVDDNLERSLARDAFTRVDHMTRTRLPLRRFRDKVQLWKNT